MRPTSEAPSCDPGATPDPRRSHHVVVGAILVVALVLRLLYLHQIAALPLFDAPVGESAEHLKLAASIRAGALLPTHPFFYASVLYPYFLAAVLALPSASLYLVCLIQILAGVALVALVMTLAMRNGGRNAGYAAGVLAALYGPFAFLEADVLGMVWGLIALTAGLLWCMRARESADAAPRRSAIDLMCAGVALGFAAAERPNLALLIPVAAGWCAWGAKPRWRAVGALAAGAVLPLALVVALNFAAAGRWIPLATSRGINLYIGNHEGATGTYDEPWSKQSAQFAARYTELEEASTRWASQRSGRALTPEQASDYWTAQAVDFVRRHPREAMGQSLRKTLLLFNAAEIPNHLDFEFIRERAPALWSMPIGFAIVLPLAAVGLGLGLARDRRRGVALLVLITAAAAASVLPFFVTERYRAAMLPPMLVLAGLGVAALARLVTHPREQRPARVAAVLMTALVLAGVSLIPLTEPVRSRDWWMLAQGYAARGDLRSAAASYEAAVREGSDDGELLNNLALTYRALGNRERAESALRHAVTANPGLAYAHKNLGMLLIGRGALDEALRELNQAATLEPDDAETLGAIGALLADRGQRAAAQRAFSRARALAPHDPRLEKLIEQYSSAQAE
jgi:tetratricopeptide (TPR) repeat protein